MALRDFLPGRGDKPYGGTVDGFANEIERRIDEVAEGIGPPTDAGIASLLGTEGTASQGALIAQNAKAGNVPVSYTWDATSGFVATITEHYPAPLGDRVTAYSAYGIYGPTHELDPDGGEWTLTYDTAGNPTEREAV